MSSTHTPRRYLGISIIEILLALAISATLLTALVVSVNASLIGVRSNETQALLATKARNTLGRMLDQLRRSSLHKPYTTSGTAFDAFRSSPTAMTDTGFTVREQHSDGSSTNYTYYFDSSDAANGKLMATTQDFDSTGTATGSVNTLPLLNNVTAFSVTLYPGKSNVNLTENDIVLRATVALQIIEPNTGQANRQTIAMSGSASPRTTVYTGSKLAFPYTTYLQ